MLNFVGTFKELYITLASWIIEYVQMLYSADISYYSGALVERMRCSIEWDAPWKYRIESSVETLYLGGESALVK